MNLRYLIPRLVRHFLPERLVRFLLLRNLIIQAGIETNDPDAAVQRYVDILAEQALSLNEKRVMVFGYGGRFDIGFALLKRGARHVVLCDKYAPPDEIHNQRLFNQEERYFALEKDRRLRPRSEWMTLIEADIRDAELQHTLKPVDIVISSSVYEHVDDVEGITRALARLTKPDGLHIHFIDLRDHFFKYPFEMLRFSENTWRRWLNPSSNHNRYRLWNYRAAFGLCFKQVEIQVLAQDENAFRELLPHIRPEFISGTIEQDSVTLILVIASGPY